MTSRVILAGYAVLAAVAVGLEVWARRSNRICTFGSALAAVLRYRSVRFLVLTAWLWLGWHIFVRVDRP